VLCFVNPVGHRVEIWAVLGDWLRLHLAAIGSILGSAFIATLISIRGNRAIQSRQFRENERVRLDENRRKASEELYQLLLKHTIDAPFASDRNKIYIDQFPEDSRGAALLARAKELEEKKAGWNRIETLIRLNFPNFEGTFEEMVSCVQEYRAVCAAGPEVIQNSHGHLQEMRDRSLRARKSLLSSLEQEQRALKNT
jgi:hypothetical protein